ncbi:glycerol-3-phosphate acyltransferase 1, mitochondrial [Plutella xylostella]|uniref:glycerol-3-phosphate acyltransferase 1, mitochondrial n=1 Tax=Plutella xylostella TaxID=51655 RepID=UPI0020325BE7|nr:glycerol-3-phosphate acyltransferase 1, mitochondrial [Plutella xylostella]
MDTMLNVWSVVEHARVASGAAELAIFTAILYWFFTSSRVADMLEVVGERVGGWCGRDPSSSLRQAVRAKKRQHQADVYARLDAEKQARSTSLYRVKDGPVVPPPQPPQRATAGLACARCAPLSRESWRDPQGASDSGAVINILDIGRQTYANGGVVSRCLCDVAQCVNLTKYDYKDMVPEVVKDDRFQQAIEETTQQELRDGGAPKAGKTAAYVSVRRRVEASAMRILADISSAMSNNVLRFVAWACHKAIRRVAGGGCGTRAASIERLRRAKAAGLPLIFVPLHRSHFDYILVTFTLYLTGLRPPLVAAGDNMRIPFFGWFLRGCGAFYIRRRIDGSEYHGDPVYKSALRAYILNSLSAKNNLEFFIEGGRTRTGKPQPPKAGILSVIMDAYLDGTIDDALLVPVTLNYDKLVDGNFAREQLGRAKQMETFWSALRGIWRTLHTDHGSIRVDFCQPSSLKELVTSFQKYNHLKSPISPPLSLSPANNNASLATHLDRQILFNHSHSSLYGADVSTEHKMMVEAIARHLVYDAAKATALMSTNVVSYVLLTEFRRGCSLQALAQRVTSRAARLCAAGRDLGYSGEPGHVVRHALDMLGTSLVLVTSRGAAPRASIPAALELAYYCNTVVAHYAPPAIVATALESIIRQPGADPDVVRHSTLMQASLELCVILSQEFILTAPCQRTEELITDTIGAMIADETISSIEPAAGLQEQQWSRRLAQTLDFDEEEERDRTDTIKYRVNHTPEAIAERRRLILTIRPLLEAYSATCRCLASGVQKEVVKNTLDYLTDEYSHNRMVYGEAVSTDAIRNCMRVLKQWNVIDVYSEGRNRLIRICAPYDDPPSLQAVCQNVYKFNMDTPLLAETA